jgi:hypothetical protein
MAQSKGVSAWLLTWDWANDAAAVSDAVAAILSPKLSEVRVAWFVEQLYALRTSNAAGLAAIAKDPDANPYRAQIEGGRIHCGQNPMLAAEKVNDLRVSTDSDSRMEVISWTKKQATEGQRNDQRVLTRKFRRRIAGPMTFSPIWRRDEGRFAPGWEDYRGIEIV